MAIEKIKLQNGDTKYVVRVKRYGRRRVLLRTPNPHAAIHVEVEQYRRYLEHVYISGNDKSTGYDSKQQQQESIAPMLLR